MRRLFLLACLGLAACGDEAPPRVATGTAAPAFAGAALDGGQRRFPADFAGRPLAIVFWNASCPPCIRELRAIEQVRREATVPLPVVAIHVGQEAPIGRLDPGFPVLRDEDGAIARRYGVVGLPTTYFVDDRGIIRGKVVGEADAAGFAPRTPAPLGETSPPGRAGPDDRSR